MSAIIPVTDYWCNTRLERTNVSFLWTIDNLCDRKVKENEYIKSSTFTAGKDIETKWCLAIKPCTRLQHSDGFVGLFLKLEESNRKEVMTTFKLSLISEMQEYDLKIGIYSNQ